MKLLFQSDDFGFTKGVTLGILDGIQNGIVRNTGLFVNMPSSKWAAEEIKKHPDICVGIDINFVAGKPVSDSSKVPSLVDKDGHFIKSTERSKVKNDDGDIFNYDEVLLETENQVKRFIELMGRNPGYMHGHSISSSNSKRAAKVIAEKYGILRSSEVLAKYRIPCTWTPKPFSLEQQYETDSEMHILKVLKENANSEIACFVCHCGYVDAELLDESTYSIIRTRDLAAATSKQIKEWLTENHVELITYRDINL